MILSHTELSTFQRCHREHHYRYVLRRAPREDAEPLRFGKLWSTFLETRAIPPITSHETAKLVAMALGYLERWSDEPFETLGVEVPFRIRGLMFDLHGRLDRVARDRRTGEIVLIESKTTSDEIAFGASYWRMVSAMDPQISTYYPGARAAGFNVQRCVYDVVRKPQVRPYKATAIEARKFTKDGALYKTQRETDETPEEYFERIVNVIAESPDKYYARGDVVRLERDEREHAVDVWETAQLIALGRRTRNPQSCKRFSRFCNYFDVCSGVASIESMPVRESETKEKDEI